MLNHPDKTPPPHLFFAPHPPHHHGWRPRPSFLGPGGFFSPASNPTVVAIISIVVAVMACLCAPSLGDFVAKSVHIAFFGMLLILAHVYFYHFYGHHHHPPCPRHHRYGPGRKLWWDHHYGRHHYAPGPTHFPPNACSSGPPPPPGFSPTDCDHSDEDSKKKPDEVPLGESDEACERCGCHLRPPTGPRGPPNWDGPPPPPGPHGPPYGPPPGPHEHPFGPPPVGPPPFGPPPGPDEHPFGSPPLGPPQCGPPPGPYIHPYGSYPPEWKGPPPVHANGRNSDPWMMDHTPFSPPGSPTHLGGMGPLPGHGMGPCGPPPHGHGPPPRPFGRGRRFRRRVFGPHLHFYGSSSE